MKQVARGNQILAVSNGIFWQENLASMSSASQVLMALKNRVLKGWKERKEKRQERKKEERKSFHRSVFTDIGQKVLPIYFFPQKILCNFEQLRWNVMINNAFNLQYWKGKKIKALIDKFFPKEHKNIYTYQSALEIVEYSKFW